LFDLCDLQITILDDGFFDVIFRHNNWLKVNRRQPYGAGLEFSVRLDRLTSLAPYLFRKLDE